MLYDVSYISIMLSRVVKPKKKAPSLFAFKHATVQPKFHQLAGPVYNTGMEVSTLQPTPLACRPCSGCRIGRKTCNATDSRCECLSQPRDVILPKIQG